MTEFWETVFSAKKAMWGPNPTASAILAGERFARAGVKRVLIPGFGYGRNAKVFLDHGMSVEGIEISATAIALARSELLLEVPIHHGSVLDMPFDAATYDGIYCFGLLYLLNAEGRAKFIRDCHRQLEGGGLMEFTVISKEAPMYGEGPKLGEDWYERHPGLPMFFYDDDSVRRELGAFGLVDLQRIEEPMPSGEPMPFIHAICRKA